MDEKSIPNIGNPAGPDNWDPATYDAERRRLVPDFEGFYGTAVELIIDACAGRSRPRILDLGAGTGLLSQVLLDRLDAEVTAFDGSPAMLARLRTRFGDRVTTVVGDLAGELPPGPWDAVMSALAIHHLTDDDKQALFARVLAVLAPGGVFVNAEQILGPSPWLEERNARQWERDARALGATDTEINGALERMRSDRCTPVKDQRRWLRHCGFTEVDCPYQRHRFAVLAAWKGPLD
jgi:tRNA (cmo5U34)-methyltransferase